MNIKINRISVMQKRSGPDIIWLYTDLPCSFVPEFLPEQPNADLRLDATAGTGLAYVQNNFPDVDDVEVISV